MTPRLVIKSHHPRRFWLRVVLLVVLIAVAGWGLRELGRFQAGHDANSLSQEAGELRQRLARVEQEREELGKRVAILERSSQVDQQAYGEVERVLKQTQDEMLELEEEVAFYRGIFAPAETSSGLNIADFRVSAIGEQGAFRFKLVLTQVQARERMVEGTARIQLEGVQGGNRVQLGLKEVTGGSLDRLPLHFRYFQNNEGEIVLPEGFLPSRVMVEVVPTVKGMSVLKKTFDWSDIIK